jgi:AraC-like DNA-binding protein
MSFTPRARAIPAIDTVGISRCQHNARRTRFLAMCRPQRKGSGATRPAAESMIRHDWMFEVRSACQQFGCRTLHADVFDFGSAVDEIGGVLQEPISVQERDALRDLLKICAVDGAVACHRTYHMRVSDQRCVDSPLETTLPLWVRSDEDPRITWRRWGEAFVAAFHASHPSPPSHRAAAILRARFTKPPALQELAKLVLVSKTALTSDFRRRNGISAGEYLTRVRLRWFVEEIRKPGATSASRLAERAGYSSYHNLLQALRRRTGLLPTQVRHLTPDQARELLDTKLFLLPFDIPQSTYLTDARFAARSKRSNTDSRSSNVIPRR